MNFRRSEFYLIDVDFKNGRTVLALPRYWGFYFGKKNKWASSLNLFVTFRIRWKELYNV